MVKVSTYPEDNVRKGQIRVDRVKIDYELQGYKVTVNKLHDSESIDMIAENSEEIIALEVTNWNIRSRLNYRKYLGWVRHWSEVEKHAQENGDTRLVRRRLVYNYRENIQFMLEWLYKSETELEEIGYEDLPEETKQ